MGGHATIIDAAGLVDQLQKSAVLLAHALQKVSWYRRVHVLGAIGKIKDAKEILKREKIQKIFVESKTTDLFSKEFTEEIKIEKKSTNIVEILKPKKPKEAT